MPGCESNVRSLDLRRSKGSANLGKLVPVLKCDSWNFVQEFDVALALFDGGDETLGRGRSRNNERSVFLEGVGDRCVGLAAIFSCVDVGTGGFSMALSSSSASTLDKSESSASLKLNKALPVEPVSRRTSLLLIAEVSAVFGVEFWWFRVKQSKNPRGYLFGGFRHCGRVAGWLGGAR